MLEKECSSIRQLKNCKTTGTDEISIMILNAISDHILSHLAHYEYICVCVETGKFLTFLEIATVLSIHEEDNPKDMVNYPLIAILNVFSKIDEKNFYNLMVAFLDKHNLLSDCQHLPKMLLSSYWKNSSSLLMVAGTWYI